MQPCASQETIMAGCELSHHGKVNRRPRRRSDYMTWLGISPSHFVWEWSFAQEWALWKRHSLNVAFVSTSCSLMQVKVEVMRVSKNSFCSGSRDTLSLHCAYWSCGVVKGCDRPPKPHPPWQSLQQWFLLHSNVPRFPKILKQVF